MTNSNNLKDIQIDVKYKLSALWIAVMCCYIYGDFFTLFVPGRIEHLMTGDSGAGSTTPFKILLFAIMMSLPSLMIFFSLHLRAKWNRLLNICLGIFFTLIMILVVVTSISTWMLFYVYLGVVEIILTCGIVVLAWKWSRI